MSVRVLGDERAALKVRPGDPGLRRFGIAVLVLAIALLANSVAGPLLAGWVTYPIPESLLNQLLGLEVVTLVLVVPVAFVAAVLALRTHPMAPVLAFGPAAYTAYMFVQYVVGPDYTSYSLVVVAHVAITSLAGILTLWSWSLSVRRPMPVSGIARRRRRALLLALLAGFVLLRYVPGLVGAVTGEPIPAEFLDARAFFWSIFLLDLGVVVPGVTLAALAMWRGAEVAERAYCAVLGWFVMVPPSVAAMAAVMVLRDDPYASVPTLVLLTVASVVFAVPAVLAVRTSRRYGPDASAPGS